MTHALSDHATDEPAEAVVRAYVEAVQRARRSNAPNTWDAVEALLHDDVVWQFAGGGTGELWPRQLRGRPAVVEVLSAPELAWDRLQTETRNLVGMRDLVLVEQVSTLVDDTGAATAKPVAHVFSVEGRRIKGIRTYRNDARPAS